MTEGSPRWVADEMLGRLARYLRIFGHDVEYVRGLEDEEVAERARSEGRVLVTRDRALARRVPGSLLLRSPWIGGQLREVRAAFPSACFEPRFDRCTRCNAPLERWSAPTSGQWPEELPVERVRQGLAVFCCPACGQRYWEGSHAERIRREVATWLSEKGP